MLAWCGFLWSVMEAFEARGIRCRGGRRGARLGRPGPLQAATGRQLPGAAPSRAVRSSDQTDDERKAALRERCVEALRQFMTGMAAESSGVRPSCWRYLTWRRGTSRRAAPRTFDQFGGFSALLTEAMRRAQATLGA